MYGTAVYQFPRFGALSKLFTHFRELWTIFNFISIQQRYKDNSNPPTGVFISKFFTMSHREGEYNDRVRALTPPWQRDRACLCLSNCCLQLQVHHQPGNCRLSHFTMQSGMTKPPNGLPFENDPNSCSSLPPLVAKLMATTIHSPMPLAIRQISSLCLLFME